MCGILGSFTRHPSFDQDQRLQSALAALHHRGPDDRGLETFDVAGGRLALGHTRLSIIDLSPGGHQPMHSPDGRYTIVFNGEIYNYRELRTELKAQGHRFYTDSDTEVLLAAWGQWGVAGLRRLTGMFAFAVFDRVAQTLTLVRDAFGIKPLFVRREGTAVYFASEVPALLELLLAKPELNLQRAYDYLVWGQYDNASDTFYQGVEHLLPGHWLAIDLQQVAADQPTRPPRLSLRRGPRIPAVRRRGTPPAPAARASADRDGMFGGTGELESEFFSIISPIIRYSLRKSRYL